MKSNLKIPKKSIKLMEESVINDYKNISKNPRFGVDNQFNINRVKDRFDNIQKDLNLWNLKDKKILEVGSGSGLLVAYLRKKEVKAYGIEPEKRNYRVSQLLLKENKIKNCIKNGFGEKIPYKDNYFDLIVSFQVLEHTQNPRKVLKESKRVLKKGGLIYFVVPNYYSFWEGHYGVPWIPIFNKTIAKMYVKILGRDEKFIDALQFITPKKLRLLSKELNLEVISLGEEQFRKNISEEKIKEYWATNNLLGNLIWLIRKFKIDKFISWLFIKCDFYYPIVLIAKKT